MTRRNAREQAFFVLFEKIFDNDSAVSEIVKNQIKDRITSLKSVLNLTDNTYIF